MLYVDMDVSLIWEPYAHASSSLVVANVPPGFSSFHQLDAELVWPWILVRESFAKLGRLTAKHLPNSTASVDLMTSSGPTRPASIYLRPPLSNFSQFSNRLRLHFLFSASMPMLKALYGTVPAQTVVALSWKACIDYKLNVANQPLELLEFILGGTSFVDLTLTGDHINLSRSLFLSTLGSSIRVYWGNDF